jgi:hypothetical protein
MTSKIYSLEEWFVKTTLDKYPMRYGKFHNSFYRWLEEVRIDSKGRIINIKKASE